jgi:hypothetical protein
MNSFTHLSLSTSERDAFEARYSEVLGLPILEGSHQDREDQLAKHFCVIEAASYIANEPWSDAPQCVCPTITQFMVSWNDLLPNDDDRGRLLKPLIPRIIGTRSTDDVAERRAFMALDWLVRVHTPRWLDLTDALKPHAKALRDLPEIVDLAGALAAGESLKAAQQAADAARDAAWDAAWAAAWDATRDAAWDAACAAAWDATRDAACAAARDAAWDATRDAAWAAARDAAWDATRDAACAAARDAAWAALKPTTEWLQASAQQLVIRMCEYKGEAAA